MQKDTDIAFKIVLCFQFGLQFRARFIFHPHVHVHVHVHRRQDLIIKIGFNNFLSSHN